MLTTISRIVGFLIFEFEGLLTTLRFAWKLYQEQNVRYDDTREINYIQQLQNVL